MKVVLTGGTGYIGSALLTRLLADGHEVNALVRGEEAAATISGRGGTPVIGDLYDTDWVADQFAGAEGVIHLAAAGDGTSEKMDRAVTAAAIRALSGTGRPYVHTGGIWTYGDNADITEESPSRPPSLTAWRLPVEASVLDAPGLAATLVQPGIVYGYGAGIPGGVLAGQQPGPVWLVGDGSQHWTTIHVDDVAALYALVVAQGTGLGRVVAVSGDNPTVREIASAAAGDAGVIAETVTQTRERLGAFGEALLLDQQGAGAKARSLGWKPAAPTLVEEFRTGSYAP